ncbi:site-specific integrase [Flocculibacter collagenilyticus]|uniref:hypothetical protein n=1 Tax=Flocculibacter collagenilyticus TaxID=2744479 RepID=UPI0018F4897D|nr:hypothetical protein [Flocculibacter collagenilyticus]
MKKHVGRRPFSIMEVRALFSGYIYSDFLISHEQPRDWQFWLPLLAWFTGANSEELALIAKNDIAHHDQRYFVTVGNHSRLASRTLPLHHCLIDAGFIEWMNQQPGSPEQRLFSDLPTKNNRYSEKIRLWFSGDGDRQGYMQKCDIPSTDSQGKKTAFSSFRANFEAHIKQQCQRLQINPTNYLAYTLGTKVRGSTVSISQLDKPTLHHLIDSIGVPAQHISWQRFATRVH